MAGDEHASTLTEPPDADSQKQRHFLQLILKSKQTDHDLPMSPLANPERFQK